MSSIVNPQSTAAAGAGAASLMYAPPPSTLVASPYTTSLFVPSQPLTQARHRGSANARQHTPSLHLPALTHSRLHLLPGVEEQPF